MHQEMLDAMITMGFNPIEIQSLMRLVAAVLYIGNMQFVEYADGAILVQNENSQNAEALLYVSLKYLAKSFTSRIINARSSKSCDLISY